MLPGPAKHPKISEPSEGNDFTRRVSVDRNSVESEMAIVIQNISQPPFSAPQYSPRNRPVLPSIFGSDGPLPGPNRIPKSSPIVAEGVRQYSVTSVHPSTSHGHQTNSTRSSMSSTQESTFAQHSPELLHQRPSSRSAFPRLPPLDMSIHSLKRPFGALSHSINQKPYQHHAPILGPNHADSAPLGNRPPNIRLPSPSSSLLPAHGSHFSPQHHPRYAEPVRQEFRQSQPSHTYQTISPPPSNAHRCSLHIRQQPRAARAGPDGKDRRSIDPPPVLQLMLSDFDAYSEADMAEIRSSCFVVHCRLISPYPPRSDVSTLSSINDDGSSEIQRLLLGTTVSSPFFCEDDPDPSNMPRHPKGSEPSNSAAAAPPSPTARFLHPRSTAASKLSAVSPDGIRPTPGAFFIFPDLSVRKAGEYRLEFTLMKIEPAMMIAGARLPIISTVTSPVFRVVNAKDFDQVQPSTDLVKGLLDRGAGFPLKLKKGTRESSSNTKQRDGNSVSDNEEEGAGGEIEASDGDD